MHPILWSQDDEREDELKVLKFPYFEMAEPLMWEDANTYTDGDTHLEHTVNYEWNHSIGEIITSLIDAGLRIEIKGTSKVAGDVLINGVRVAVRDRHFQTALTLSQRERDRLAGRTR